MMKEPTDAYERFCEGYPGVCTICGSTNSRGWSDGDEIEFEFGSVEHDTSRFVWMDNTPADRPIGYVCDSCATRLQDEGRIALYSCPMDRERVQPSEAALAAVERLHQKRGATTTTPDNRAVHDGLTEDERRAGFKKPMQRD